MKKEDFKQALENRLKRRLEIQTFDEMTVCGSKLRFDMSMAIDGYPFKLPEDANEEDYERLLTSEQYMSGKFDDIIHEVYSKAFDEYSDYIS